MRYPRFAPSARVAVLAIAVTLAGCGSAAPTTSTATTAVPGSGPAGSGSPSRVETRSFHSDALGVDKDYVLYLPAGYDDDATTRWPVLYYLHGLTGNETNWTEAGGLAHAADQLGLRAIVVMPDGDDGFYVDAPTDYDHGKCLENGAGLLIADAPKHKTCVRHRKYETYVMRDLIGHIDGSLRTIAAREGRAIAGLSMGGFGALSLGIRHRDVFAAAASHSGLIALLYKGPHPYQPATVELTNDVSRWGIEAGPIGAWIRGVFGPDLARWRALDPASLVAALAPGDLALYLDSGTEDGFLLHDHAAYVHDLLDARKIAHVFFLGPGGHDMGFWRSRVKESLAFLTAHVATPTR